jgi:hypothetical protein
VRNKADNIDGLVAGWRKTSWRETKRNGDVELKRRRDLVMATSREGFLFVLPWDCNSHTKPSEVGAGGGALRGLGDVIVAAEKRCQSDATTSYSHGTGKDGGPTAPRIDRGGGNN